MSKTNKEDMTYYKHLIVSAHDIAILSLKLSSSGRTSRN